MGGRRIGKMTQIGQAKRADIYVDVPRKRFSVDGSSLLRLMPTPLELTPASPLFVGRNAELTALQAAAEAADSGTAQAVLVRGEAGVGKTRLVEELLRRLGKRAVTAVASCIEVGGDEVPLAPFSTVLRELWRQRPEEIRSATAGQKDLLSRILPELGSERRPGTDGENTSRLFELIIRVLEQLAADRLVVIVIEDLHWADASTRHLLGYLFRAGRGGRFLLLATYRSDDIHRRHPLRVLLAEADRMRSIRRIDLPRFDRVEVLHQLTGILGISPDPVLLDKIFDRSDGNAFFVEELARSAGGPDRAGLDKLRDLLLVRLEALPERSQRVARIATQSGPAVGYSLLKAVAGVPEEVLIEALRRSVLAQVLVPAADGSGYRFRHALVREAVSETLLPGERSLINRRYAEAIEADPDLIPMGELTARLARHWHDALDRVRALELSLRAATEARARFAYAEQLLMLERALSLWDLVPNEIRASLPALDHPEAYPPQGSQADASGLSAVDVLASACVAARQSGDHGRALTLTQRALDQLREPAHALRAAWFWIQASMLNQDLNHGDGRPELRRAHELAATGPPSVVHAEVLVQLASWGAKHRPGPESRAAADRAVEYAASLGTEDLELHARITRCWLNTETDTDGAYLAELYDVRRRAEAGAMVGLIGRANHNLPSILEGMGRTGEAIRAADHGVAACHALGLAETEAWVQGNRAFSLFSAGRLAEAEAGVELAAASARSSKARGVIACRRALHLLVRGEVDAAAEELARGQHLIGTKDLQPQFQIPLIELRLLISARQGRTAEARTDFLRADAVGLSVGPVRYALPLLCTAAAIEADAPDGSTHEVLAAVRRAASRLPVTSFPVFRAYTDLLQAELHRADGSDRPGRWADLVTAFAPLHRPFQSAGAHLGQARALLAAHQSRAKASTELERAAEIAVRIGASLMSRDIETVASRFGFTAATNSEPESVAGWPALTARESEVLVLVAEGYANRRIAEKLFIAPKTAATHVSSILAKLGASSRTEAAAMVHRSRKVG